MLTRLLSATFLAASLVVPFISEGSAQVFVCPDGFVPTTATLSPETDKNGNGVICVKQRQKACRVGQPCNAPLSDDKIQ